MQVASRKGRSYAEMRKSRKGENSDVARSPTRVGTARGSVRSQPSSCVFFHDRVAKNLADLLAFAKF